MVVYAVSTQGIEESQFLEKLTDMTGGATLKVESTKNLSGTFLKILEEFRQRYLISFSPSGVAKDGWHRLEVRVKNRRVNVKARTGYQAGT
jgi:VWFA-related protein